MPNERESLAPVSGDKKVFPYYRLESAIILMALLGLAAIHFAKYFE